MTADEARALMPVSTNDIEFTMRDVNSTIMREAEKALTECVVYVPFKMRYAVPKILAAQGFRWWIDTARSDTTVPIHISWR